MTLQTVRVANPRTETGYMVINAADYREAVHGPLWHTQEPGFDGRMPSPAAVTAHSPEEQRRAAAIMFELLEVEREERGLPTYASLSAHQRLDWLGKKHDELRDSLSRRVRRMEPPEVVVPEGVVPGETPGWPVDAETGKPLYLSQAERDRLIAAHDLQQVEGDPENVLGQGGAAELTDAQRQELARQGNPPAGGEGEPGTSQPTPPPSQEPAPQGAQGGEQPAWLRPAAPAAQQPPAAPVAEKMVEKGPGGKWYVMQAGKPVSEGFKTKIEAESKAAAE